MTGATDETVPKRPRPLWYVALRLLPPLIWVPLIAVLFMSLAIAGMSELSARRAQASNARIAQVLLRLEALADLRALIVDAETGQRGYLLTRDPVYLEPFSFAAQALPEALARLRELSVNAPHAKEVLSRASALMAERLRVASNVVRAYDQSGDRSAAIALFRVVCP